MLRDSRAALNDLSAKTLRDSRGAPNDLLDVKIFTQSLLGYLMISTMNFNGKHSPIHQDKKLSQVFMLKSKGQDPFGIYQGLHRR